VITHFCPLLIYYVLRRGEVLTLTLTIVDWVPRRFHITQANRLRADTCYAMSLRLSKPSWPRKSSSGAVHVLFPPEPLFLTSRRLSAPAAPSITTMV